MDRGHPHDHGAPGHAHLPQSAAGLRIAFVVTASILVLEAVGGWITGSVALLADAGHMLTDAGALGVALFAAWVAVRPRSGTMSFGYGRAEILAALGNGLLLGAVSVAIAFESIERLGEPREIDAVPMLVIAVIGLFANLVSAFFLARSGSASLNVRAALMHVIGDALGSVAAIAAALGILFFGATQLDAIAGIGIAGILVVSAVRLVREATGVLLESTPRGIDVDDLARHIHGIAGVRGVHDLHVWTVTSGFPAMSAHVDLDRDVEPEGVRESIHELCHREYDIAHTTIQTEAFREPELLQITEAAPEA